MTMFRFKGPADYVCVGVAGARFFKGVPSEVPDERLAAKLKMMESFEEVTAENLGPVTPAIMFSPDQGAPHPDPEVSEMLRARGRKAKAKAADTAGGGDGLGNINRAVQYEANVEALSGEPGNITEESADGGGEEMVSSKPPAPGKPKK